MDQILRQVFYKNSDGKARLEMVQKHMLVMEDLFRRSLLKKLYIDCQRVPIWEDEYKGKPLILYLVFREGQQKEGCLSLELIYDSVDLVNTGWEFGMHVYQIIFTLGIEEGERVNIKVGALQGMYNGSEFIKELTKAYFGCRTKNLMIWCLRCFAETIGAVKIYAVSNQGHYAMNHYRRDRKLRQEIESGYEQILGRMRGKAKGPKKIFHEIPLEEKRKKMEELKPSKRALHRRRFEKLDEIRKDIKENLGKVMHVR